MYWYEYLLFFLMLAVAIPFVHKHTKSNKRIKSDYDLHNDL